MPCAPHQTVEGDHWRKRLVSGQATHACDGTVEYSPSPTVYNNCEGQDGRAYVVKTKLSFFGGCRFGCRRPQKRRRTLKKGLVCVVFSKSVFLLQLENLIIIIRGKIFEG